MTRVAAVDVGTNSVRLLVADGPPLRSVDRRLRITRLGAGVDERGHLDDAALRRTLECLGEYTVRWRQLGAERVRVAATSAVRDARDRQRFFDGVREVTGVAAQVLTGEQEAEAAFLGAATVAAAPGPRLVLDIGGGSTELVLGDGHAEASTSRQLGCVRLRERVLRDDPPTSHQVDRATQVIDDELEAARALVDPTRAATLVGVAGTVTTLGALHLGLAGYDAERIHGTRVPVQAVERLCTELLAMPGGQRAGLGPVQAGREDVIHAGALILLRVVRLYGFDEVVVSERDSLDGLALQLLEAP